MTRWWQLASVALLIAAAPPDPDLVAGIDAYNAGHFDAAFSRLSAAAARGDPQAEVDLAYLYVRGQGVAPSRLSALLLYRQAAAKGDGEAMNALGYNYLYGNSMVERDIPEAVRWFCRAIQAGNPRAMINLGQMAEQGYGVPRDIAEARSLWQQAADRGHTNGLFNLGRSLAQEGRPEGWAMLRRAAESGNAAAQSLLRQAGQVGAWPPPQDDGTRMALEPVNKPGHTRLCGQAIS